MRLGVNIDHIATLREARAGLEPEPALAALIVERSGADSLVVHLREDRRHIKENDLWVLKEISSLPLNLEMSISKEIIDIACKIKPARTTLVPERRAELTTEGGLDVIKNFKRVKHAIGKLNKNGIEVSIFIDPSCNQIKAVNNLGVSNIELHTGKYANAKNNSELCRALNEIKKAAIYAKSLKLNVFAGHGLDYNNVLPIARIKQIEELNIGHSIVSRAVFIGLGKAVKELKMLITK